VRTSSFCSRSFEPLLGGGIGRLRRVVGEKRGREEKTAEKNRDTDRGDGARAAWCVESLVSSFGGFL
jgi:hypothetical protein